jgi:anaerobic ribonucleoside-triphosphate reductase activating protein
MNYGVYLKYDVANGEGIRCSLFVSGCSHRCPGCFNSAAWDKDYGKEFTKDFEDQIIKDLNEVRGNLKIAGLSLLGGEPFENMEGLLPLIRRVVNECPGKNIWAWSGYTFEEILDDPKKAALLQYVDVLVDGRFIEEKKKLGIRFKGSTNQRIIDVKNSVSEGKVILYKED